MWTRMEMEMEVGNQKLSVFQGIACQNLDNCSESYGGPSEKEGEGLRQYQDPRVRRESYQ